MEQLLDGYVEQIGKQPWDAPAYRADLFCYNSEMVLKSKRLTGKAFPTEPLHIWEYPHPGGGYAVAIDPSAFACDKGDPAAIQVVRYGGVQVAEMLLVDRQPEEQLRIAVWLAELYNDAVLVVEMNGGVGAYMNQRLDRIGYGRIWRNPSTGMWGWTTTKQSKREAVRTFQDSLNAGAPIMRSFRLREELMQSNGDHSHSTQDDLTMAFLLAHHCVLNQHYALMR
jgi:hypothetical protein